MKYVSEAVYDKPTVLIPRKGSLSNLFYVDAPFWNVDTIYYTEIDVEKVVPRFLYHFLLTQNLESLNIAGGVPSLTQGTLNKIPIPIPPLSVQARIVEILDKFTAMEQELEEKLAKELQMRKKQYEFYRNKLLDFRNAPPSSLKISWMKLGEVCKVQRGKRLTKKELSQKGKYAVYHGGNEPIGYYDNFNRAGNAAMIINVGASAGFANYEQQDFWSSDGCFTFSNLEQLSQRFLFYLLQFNEYQIRSKVRIAGIPTLDASVLEQLPIPIPPLAEQERIVAILDKFDTLINSMAEGLPREMELRRKQYAYYREQLLNFPK